MATDRALNWPDCANTRDLGGLPRNGSLTRRGVLVRSDCVTYLTDAGREAMRSYGVTTVIDLRSNSEVHGAQDERFRRAASHAARAAGVAYLHHALVDDANMRKLGDADNMLDRYLMMLDRRQHAFRDVFTAIAEADGTVLFHCFAGKDRTGLVAALLLSLAGVTPHGIAADFMETDRQLARQYEQWIAAAEPEKQEAMRDELRCPPDRILAVLDHVRHGWGGVAGYLEASGMPAENIARVSSKLA